MKYEVYDDHDNDGEEWKTPQRKESMRLHNIRIRIDHETEISQREADHIKAHEWHTMEHQGALDTSTEEVERIYIECIGCGHRFLMIMKNVEEGAVQALIGCPECDRYSQNKDALYSVSKH